MQSGTRPMFIDGESPPTVTPADDRPNPLQEALRYGKHRLSSIEVSRRTAEALAKRRFPSIEWMQKYNRSKFKDDCIAGLTVGVLLIPQSMAYAFLAGLSPVYGMYSSSFILIVYALMSSSSKLAVGPVAPTAILIASAIESFGVEPFTAEYAVLASELCFVTGVLQILMGMLNLGFIVKLMSRPVMSGFTTGAAFIIAVNQCRDLLGLDTTRQSTFVDSLGEVLTNLDTAHGFTALISAISVFVLMVVKFEPLKSRVPTWFPTPMLLLLVSILLSWLVDFEAAGVSIVGEVPRGIGPFAAPRIDNFFQIIPSAFIVVLFSYLGSIALAQKFATKYKESIDADQELYAFGAACLFGSFNSCHTISASFSRTALNEEMGAKTQAAGIFTGLLMILSLLVLTSVFKFLPRAVLAAMILVSVRGLFDFEELKYLWRTKPIDLIQFVACVLGVLFIGIEEGVLIAIGVSLVMLVYRSMSTDLIELKPRPDARHDWVVPGPRFITADASTMSLDDEESPPIIAYRFTTELYFGNSRGLATALLDIVREKSEHLDMLVLDLSAVSFVDSTAQRDLFEFMENVRPMKVSLRFAAPSETVQRSLELPYLLLSEDERCRIGPLRFFPTVNAAAAAKAAVCDVADSESDSESDCLPHSAAEAPSGIHAIDISKLSNSKSPKTARSPSIKKSRSPKSARSPSNKSSRSAKSARSPSSGRSPKNARSPSNRSRSDVVKFRFADADGNESSLMSDSSGDERDAVQQGMISDAEDEKARLHQRRRSSQKRNMVPDERAAQGIELADMGGHEVKNASEPRSRSPPKELDRADRTGDVVSDSSSSGLFDEIANRAAPNESDDRLDGNRNRSSDSTEPAAAENSHSQTLSSSSSSSTTSNSDLAS